MEIAALPVPAAFTGISPDTQGNAPDAPRGRRASALVKGDVGRGMPDEVILQGEVLRDKQYTYSKPKSQGADLHGNAQREGNASYSPPKTPKDAYTLRTALDAYQENIQVAARSVHASTYQIDIYV